MALLRATRLRVRNAKERIRSSFRWGKRRIEKREKLLQLWQHFEAEMRAVGFKVVDADKIDNVLRERGLFDPKEKTNILGTNERVYNLGLGEGRSNFFVFVRIVGDKLEITYNHPRKDDVALYMKGKEIFIRRTIKLGDEQEKITALVQRIWEITEYKKEDDFRLQVHFHMHHLFSRKYTLVDDGGSGVAKLIHRLMEEHSDAFCPTPHNSSDLRMHKMLQVVGEVLGMTYLPGFELTLPIESPEALNGPHMVCMFGGIEQIEKARREILEMRPNLEMPPYFSGMMLPQMFGILEGMKKEGQVAIMPAHPIIQEFIAPAGFRRLDVPLYITGLFSAVETGHIKLSEAISYGRRSTAIACYNNLGTTKILKLKNHGLVQTLISCVKEAFKQEIRRVKLIQNVASMAVAKIFEKAGVNSYFESDDHGCGDGFSAGFTQMIFGPRLLRIMGEERRKASAREIVEGLEIKDVGLNGVVFAIVDKKGIFKTVKARKRHDTGFLSNITRYWGYGRDLLKTFLNLLVENRFWTIRRMTK